MNDSVADKGGQGSSPWMRASPSGAEARYTGDPSTKVCVLGRVGCGPRSDLTVRNAVRSTRFILAASPVFLVAGLACGKFGEAILPEAPTDGGASRDDSSVAELPGAPTDVKAVANVPNGATLSFRSPAVGGPIKSFTITASPGGATREVAAGELAIIDGLTNGERYTFTLSATNAAGRGPESAPTEPVTVLAATASPRKPTACSGNDEGFVYLPEVPGATSYNIYASTIAGGAKPGATKLSSPTAGRVTFRELTNGTTYYIAVTSLLGTLESAPSPETILEPRAFAPIHDVMFLASAGKNRVDMYDGYSTMATDIGDVSRSLVGDATHIAGPLTGTLYVASSTGDMYLASTGGQRVDVFRDAATINGNVAPARSMTYDSSGVETPSGVVVDETRNVLYVSVTTGTESKILRWDDACNVAGDPPSAVLLPTAPYPKLDRQLSLDEKNDRLYVPNETNVVVFDNISKKSGAIIPAKTFSLPTPSIGKRGISYDARNDRLFVSACFDELGSVWSFERASTLPSGEIRPAQSLQTVETRGALEVHAIENRLYVLGTDATFISRWDDAKNAAATGVSSRTKAQDGANYTSAFYIR